MIERRPVVNNHTLGSTHAGLCPRIHASGRPCPGITHRSISIAWRRIDLSCDMMNRRPVLNVGTVSFLDASLRGFHVRGVDDVEKDERP